MAEDRPLLAVLIDAGNVPAKHAEALPLFKDAFDRIDSQDGWYHLCPVGSRIRAAYPDFDPRSYGHAKLSAMVLALNGLETRQDGTHFLIRLKS